MDALSFNPPPQPASGGASTLNSSFVPPPAPPPMHRIPSPVITPAPLFTQVQAQSDGNRDYGSGLGIGQRPRSAISSDEEGPNLSPPKADLRSVSAPASESTTTLPGAGATANAEPKPSLNINFGSSSLSVTSMNSYGTPPEYPAVTSPLSINTARIARTPSPLPPSSASATTPPAGARTISAAAFKRTAQLRSTSASDGPGTDKRVSSPGIAGVGAGNGIGGAPYSDVKPLTVQKRALPSSPYPPQPYRPESPVSSVARSGTPYSEQLESTGSGSGKGYESSISQDGYETEETNGRATSPSGYGQEKFVTRLDE